MSEPVFLRHTRGLALEEIAQLSGAPFAAPPHGRRIVNVAPLDRASPSDLTFLDHQKYAAAAAQTHAGACLTTAALAKYLPPHVPPFVVREPYRAFVKVTRELFPHALRPSSLSRSGTVAGAHVDPTARLEDGVTVDPGAVIGPGAEIGAGSLIGATAVIGSGVRIGRDCSIGAGATITNALIGDKVIIHPGCKIGQDGFGFVMGPKGHQKVPQIGRVIIQDEVEIGAGTTIDRGALRDTVIGEGTKIDNLVQIGHNVVVGRYCILVSQVGISGSVSIGDYAMLGGQVGVAEHVDIGEGALVSGRAGVISNIPAGGRWGGFPARPMRDWLRGQAMMNKLTRDRTADQVASRQAGNGDLE